MKLNSLHRGLKEVGLDTLMTPCTLFVSGISGTGQNPWWDPLYCQIEHGGMEHDWIAHV